MLSLLSEEDHQCDEAQEVPDGFIKEGGMIVSAVYEHSFLDEGGESGDELLGYRPAVGFLVHEVSPAAYGLGQNHGWRGRIDHIQNLCERFLLHLLVDVDAKGCAKDTSMDGQASASEIQHLPEGVILVQFKEHVVYAGTHEGQRKGIEKGVGHIVETDHTVASFAVIVENDKSHQYTDGDDDAIPHDGNAE